jgi:hypothetical protein
VKIGSCCLFHRCTRVENRGGAGGGGGGQGFKVRNGHSPANLANSSTRRKIAIFGEYSPGSRTFANLFCSDSPDLNWPKYLHDILRVLQVLQTRTLLTVYIEREHETKQVKTFFFLSLSLSLSLPLPPSHTQKTG